MNPLFHPTVKLAADACDRCATECQRPEFATFRQVAEQFQEHAEALREFLTEVTRGRPEVHRLPAYKAAK